MFAALCLASCLHLDLTLGAHPTGADKPEITGMDNPLGQVDLSWEFKPRFSTGFQHTSSIPVWEQGLGLNLIYVRFRVK